MSFGMADQETIDAMATAAATANGTTQVDEKMINEMTSAAANADDATLVRILDGAPPGTVNRPNRYDRTAIQVRTIITIIILYCARLKLKLKTTCALYISNNA